MQAITWETDLFGQRSYFVLCKKKRPRWSQLQGRWFPASLLMEIQYAIRFLPKKEHSETETCPKNTSKGTLSTFKLTVENNLIYCGSDSNHNPCCTNSKAILVTIVKIAIIIATTITFYFLGMWLKLSDETNLSAYNAMYFHCSETGAKLHPQRMQRAFDWKYMACEWFGYKKVMWQNMGLSEVPYLCRKKRAFAITPAVCLLTCVCTLLCR